MSPKSWTAQAERRSEKERGGPETDVDDVALREDNQSLQRQLLDLNSSNRVLTGRIMEMEQDAREREAKLIFPLTSANEGLQQQVLVLQQSNADLTRQLEETRKTLRHMEMEVERISLREKEVNEHNVTLLMSVEAQQVEENERRKAGFRAVAFECGLKDGQIQHSAEELERLLSIEREKSQKEVWELREKLSECYRRLRSGGVGSIPPTPIIPPTHVIPAVYGSQSYTGYGLQNYNPVVGYSSPWPSWDAPPPVTLKKFASAPPHFNF